ncbi:GDP-mannose 4,6-dehydratase [uncultured archaeon]|nr:GDP-mannose 4,6-dehydratase [uncultured archaeon]
MKLKGISALVTGSKGFIGSHLVSSLKENEVVIEEIDIKNGIDLTNWEQLHGFIKNTFTIDMIFHLGAIVFVPYSFENPRITYVTNVVGTLNLLEIARMYDIKKFIFASTYVYGQPQYLPIDEHHPIQAISPYNRSKILGEELCKGYHQDYGLHCIILRPFNIYGTGQSKDFLIPSIIAQLASKKITLENPDPMRDYVYIDDVISAYMKAATYDGKGVEIFNIGTGVSYSVKEIVDKIINLGQMNDITVSYTHKIRENEISNIVADIQKAKEKLKWQPKMDIDSGLSTMLKENTL